MALLSPAMSSDTPRATAAATRPAAAASPPGPEARRLGGVSGVDELDGTDAPACSWWPVVEVMIGTNQGCSRVVPLAGSV